MSKWYICIRLLNQCPIMQNSSCDPLISSPSCALYIERIATKKHERLKRGGNKWICWNVLTQYKCRLVLGVVHIWWACFFVLGVREGEISKTISLIGHAQDRKVHLPFLLSVLSAHSVLTLNFYINTPYIIFSSRGHHAYCDIVLHQRKILFLKQG